jgi:hypothetical protein
MKQTGRIEEERMRFGFDGSRHKTNSQKQSTQKIHMNIGFLTNERRRNQRASQARREKGRVGQQHREMNSSEARPERSAPLRSAPLHYASLRSGGGRECSPAARRIRGDKLAVKQETENWRSSRRRCERERKGEEKKGRQRCLSHSRTTAQCY